MDRNTRYKALVRILESFGLEVRDGKGSEKIACCAHRPCETNRWTPSAFARSEDPDWTRTCPRPSWPRGRVGPRSRTRCGLLGTAIVRDPGRFGCEVFHRRSGRIPAPLVSYRN